MATKTIKCGRGRTDGIEGKKARVYGGTMWRAVQGWGEGEGAMVMMGDNRELRIDKIDLWKGEVREKLEKAIEKAMLNAALSEAEGVEIEFSQKVNSMV